MSGEMSSYLPGSSEGNRRVVICDLQPQIDAGEYPVKRVVGDLVSVSAAVFADSHDALGCHLLYKHQQDLDWSTSNLTHQANDIWRGGFNVSQMGKYSFTIQGWIDQFATWHRDILKRSEAGQDLLLPLLSGALLIDEAVPRARGADAELLGIFAVQMRDLANTRVASYICPESLVQVMKRYPDLAFATTYTRTLRVSVDRVRAQYSSWYEMFPRSASFFPGRHGTLRDCEARLPIIAGLGFDVLYLPPIHPIGKAFRKGRNNSTNAAPGEVGSPWAIGSELGGHKAIHPDLGSTVDFISLVQAAKDQGMELALDIAFQCSPDHPYVEEHPEWFLKRPDGTIQYAENPPKKYQDIYPLNFDTFAWWDLWNELKSVFLYWIDLGVRIFRVDNPHTKAFPFWKWVLEQIEQLHPDVIFLAEAFTRPHPMYELAKLGFSQSYTYFTWRNTGAELSTYLLELTSLPISEFFRPNFWPNTPDILPFGVQGASPAWFAARLVLASTLSSSYGIYGDAFDLCENLPKEEGSEEYLNSEKYEVKAWNADPEAGLRPLMRKLNTIRAENTALQSNRSLQFHATGNPSLLAYSKADVRTSNVLLMVVNLSPEQFQSGLLTLDPALIGMSEGREIELLELLSGKPTTLSSHGHPLALQPGIPSVLIYQVSQQHALDKPGEHLEIHS